MPREAKILKETKSSAAQLIRYRECRRRPGHLSPAANRQRFPGQDPHRRGALEPLEDIEAQSDSARANLFDDIERKNDLIACWNSRARARGARLYRLGNKLFSLRVLHRARPLCRCQGKVWAYRRDRPTRLNYARIVPMSITAASSAGFWQDVRPFER